MSETFKPGEGLLARIAVDIEFAGGMRLAWDTEETIRSFDPGWSPPTGGGHRANLAFACESPAEVDATWCDLTDPDPVAGDLPFGRQAQRHHRLLVVLGIHSWIP